MVTGILIESFLFCLYYGFKQQKKCYVIGEIDFFVKIKNTH